MKFATREDIAAPIETVFASVSDFEGFERAALRRGTEIVRMDARETPGEGMRWKTQFNFRNRARTADITLTEYDPPNGLTFFALIGGIEADVRVDLLALSRQRTRMALSFELKPTTIPARLMLQSVKLARGNLTKRLQKRVADFAAGIETRNNPQKV
jgi:uncharacterized protein YndB with AHSA1/START domain